MIKYTMKILYVEDDKIGRGLLTMSLKKEGLDVVSVDDPKKAVDIVKNQQIDLVISDLKMPDIDGYELLKKVKEINPTIKVIIVTAYGDVELAVNSIKEGADDFITKPFDTKALLKIIKNIEKNIVVDSNVANIQNNIEETERRKEFSKKLEDASYPSIIGTSKALKNILSKVSIIADKNLPVLITGESGTGKELIADMLYNLGDRRDKKLIKINCAAIPEDLLESELFGYEKGAFTGAVSRKKGKFEVSDKGSIFLDEIGELSYNTQGKLLRFLQNSEIQRVGGIDPIKVDVRVISATNKDLDTLVKSGKFRKDLYFRLSGINLNLPPLRERKEDIPLLIEHFIDKYTQRHGIKKKEFSKEALDILMKYTYPGNIRELENILQHALLFTIRDVIYPDDLPVKENKKYKESLIPDYPVPLKEFIEDIEKKIIIKA
jgi:two-component system, NtrC family, response regulator AtoC